MHYYDFYESPHGQMLLVADDEGLAGVYFERSEILSASRVAVTAGRAACNAAPGEA